MLCVIIELTKEQEKTVFIHVWTGCKHLYKEGRGMAGKGNLAAKGPGMEGILLPVGLLMPLES